MKCILTAAVAVMLASSSMAHAGGRSHVTGRVTVDVDLYVETGVVSLGAIIEGRSSIAREKERGGLFLSGDPGLARSMDRWLRTSVYAEREGIDQLS